MRRGRVGRTMAVAMAAIAWVNGTGAATVPCEPKSGEPEVSLARHVEPILEEHCTACHSGGNVQMDLNLEYGLSWYFLVNRPAIEADLLRIHPGEPEKSYVIHKLRGTHIDVGGAGDRMPLEKEPLTDAQITLIAGWIKGCALRN